MNHSIQFQNTKIIIFIVVIALAAGCIGQQPPQPSGLYNLTKDGVLYEFNNNIYDSLDVPVIDKEIIYQKMIAPGYVWILYNEGDNYSSVAVASANIVSRLQHYNTYSLGRMILFNSSIIPSQTGINLSGMAGTLIEVRGPVKATSTSVSIENGIIVVQGADYTQLSMAADRLTLILFEDDLRQMGIPVQ